MSNEMRYRKSGEFITVAVDSATVIEVGDMLFLDTDDAKPASAFTWDTDLATTQTSFKPLFLGISMHQSKAGETNPVLIRMKGVFEMDCAAATFAVGTLVGPDDNATPDGLVDQIVIASSTAARSVGRAWKAYAANTTRVLVYFKSFIYDMD